MVVSRRWQGPRLHTDTRATAGRCLQPVPFPWAGPLAQHGRAQRRSQTSEAKPTGSPGPEVRERPGSREVGEQVPGLPLQVLACRGLPLASQDWAGPPAGSACIPERLLVCM